MTAPGPPLAPGAWPSPITASLVVASSVGLGGPQLAGGRVWWSEARPHEGGRVQLVHRSLDGDGGAVDVLPEGFSARSRAHEYGGGAWWATDTDVVFTNADDQRLWRCTLNDDGVPTGPPTPLTPEPPTPTADRHADLRPTGDRRWWVCVREPDAGHAPDELIAVRTDPDGDPVAPVMLWSGSDFVSNPRVSPDGRLLCWLAWDLPDMPWQSSVLWVAELVHDDPDGTPRLGTPAAVLGDGGVSLAQPDWMPDGRLAVVSDDDNWWNLWVAGVPGRPDGSGFTQATVVGGELAPPQWVFGQQTWGTTSAGDVVGVWRADGNDHIGVMGSGTDEIHWVHSGHTAVEGVAVVDGTVALIAGSFTAEHEVVVIGFDDLRDAAVSGTRAPVRVRRAARDLGLDAGWFTWPDPVSVPTTSGKRTHALVYPPANPDMGAWDGPTPLMVLIHGGPTAAARPLVSMAVRYWTSRGWTVADVNYRGSTGYGRRYRDQLHEGWGVVDVADCVAVAQWLADQGRVDADRMVIRGGSAGGFTTLAALCDSDVFAAGTSLYGIADLGLLTAETHRFESGYNDWLVGALPEHADRYVDRSPIHHIDRLDRPLLVLHGAQDAVVPPSQAELVVGALRSAGVPVGYLLFDGEQHGFRRAETLERALVAEAYFLASVLDLPGGHESPPGYGGPWPPVDIENLSGH